MKIKKSLPIIFIIIAFFLFLNYKKEYIVSYYLIDIDGDNNDELICITRKGYFKKYIREIDEEYGDHLKIYNEYEIKNNNIKLGKALFTKELEELKPIKVLAGDIDGDNIMEISLIVYKKTLNHDIYQKRPFFYNLGEDDLIPKWRGTSFSRPFYDYILFDINKDGKDDVISLDYLENGDKILVAYSWRVFGFEPIGFSKPISGNVDFKKDLKNDLIIINNNMEKTIYIDNEKIIINEVE